MLCGCFPLPGDVLTEYNERIIAMKNNEDFDEDSNDIDPEDFWTDKISFDKKDLIEDLYTIHDDLNKALELLLTTQIKRCKTGVYYNTCLKIFKLEVMLDDINEHTHILQCALTPKSSTPQSIADFDHTLRYDFHGEFDGRQLGVKSFAEVVMKRLWEFGVESELCNCSKSVTISTEQSDIFFSMKSALEAIITEIKPIGWFYCLEPQEWKFKGVFDGLNALYQKVKTECSRWRNVAPKNFIFDYFNDDEVKLSLVYTDDVDYEMTFSIGLSEHDLSTIANSMSELVIKYEFRNLVKETDGPLEYAEYIDMQNRRMVESFCEVFSKVFSYKSRFIPGEDDFQILINNIDVYQKFYLFLDMIIPLKDEYRADKPYNTKKINNVIDQLNSQFDALFKIDERIFRNGFYRIDEQDCPF